MRARASLVLITATATFTFALPAQARSLDRLSEPRAALARVQAARSLLWTGSLAGAVRATASLVEATIPDVALPPVSPADAALLAGLEPDLARPVGRLLAAVREAGRITARGVRDPAAVLRVEAEEERLRASLDDPSAPAPDLVARMRALRDEAQKLVDRDALHRAALLLARTIDLTLPELRASAARSTPAAAAACDVADLAPALCIGGTGSSTYTADYALHIDQGGDDTYTNSAGGADPAASPLRPPVAVVIDLGGNDRYATVNPTPSGARVSIGSGMMGGSGILVDAAGDDTYVTTHGPVAPGSETTAKILYSQGTGATGTGILADLGGDDSYTVSNTAGADTVVSHQNRASAGLGLLLDRGAGDDTYLVEATASAWVDGTSPPKVHPGGGTTSAFGVAILGGAALFADDGGKDSETTIAASATVAPEDPRPQAAATASSISAFGWANMGGAAVVAGVGDTTRVALAETHAQQAPAASVSGFGNTFQFAALVDEGGNDVYRAEAISEAHRTASIADGCSCSGLATSATSGAATISVGGWGSGAGTALLLDEAGDDTYQAVATSSAVVSARDDRTEPDPFGGVKGTATSAAASATAWGYGQGGGRGLLRDEGGNDSYEARASSTASAEASAFQPEDPATHPIEGHAIAGSALGRSQAVGSLGGVGQLIDLGGGDTYSSTNASTAVAEPATEEKPGTAVSSVQGSSEDQAGLAGVGGIALFFDDEGPADSFSATPADPTAMGTRGQGAWQDAGPGAAAGVNR